MEEKLPPACAFAISVLAEYNQDPTDKSKLPSRLQLVQQISGDQFIGFSSLITLQRQSNIITSTTTSSVILGIQQDGSVQIDGSWYE